MSEEYCEECQGEISEGSLKARSEEPHLHDGMAFCSHECYIGFLKNELDPKDFISRLEVYSEDIKDKLSGMDLYELEQLTRLVGGIQSDLIAFSLRRSFSCL